MFFLHIELIIINYYYTSITAVIIIKIKLLAIIILPCNYNKKDQVLFSQCIDQLTLFFILFFLIIAFEDTREKATKRINFIA